MSRPSCRSTSPPTISARSAKPVRSRLCRIAAPARRSRSTKTALSHPRLRASIPRAPVPAYRSKTRPPSKNCPNELNRLSRTRSEVGRTPSGTVAGRVPRAVPAIILTRSLPERPLDVRPEELTDFPPQRPVVRPVECRVLCDERERLATCLDQNVYVPQELRHLEVWHPALAAPEQGSLPPDGQVHLRELEAVLVLRQRLQAPRGVLGLRVPDEQAFGGM